MKNLFTLLTALTFGSLSFGQIVFQSDLSSWGGGDPTDWMGATTNIASADVVEQTSGVTYGSSMASLINTTTTHKRFTTQAVTVTPGQTYEIKMWVAASMGDLRTNYYDATNAAYGTYNPYFNMATESGGNLVMLSQNVTIPAGCTSAEFILSLRNTDPTYAGSPYFLGILVDSVDISVASVTYTPTSIYDIQYTTSVPADSPEMGNYVETSGVVTAVNPGVGYWIQDGEGAFTGVYVKDAANTPSRNDSVTVQGQVEEFFNATQIINVVSHTLEPTPTVVPNPTLVSSAQINTEEEWEGVLIEAQNAECVNTNAGFGMWTINTNPGTAADSALVDDDLYSFNPMLGAVYGVTGIGHYSFSERKILPRDINDIAGAGSGIVSIYDIQYTTDVLGNSPYNGSVVTTKGVVTGVFQIGSDVDRFFIQDGDGAWNGIFVYENGYTVALGDSITVTGEVLEFNGLTEIGYVSDVTILNSGNTLPTPANVTNATVGDEEWEGVLVTLTDGECISATNGFGEWIANDGSASDVKIDDDLLPATFNAVVGNYYTVSGVRHFTFGENKIYPRTDAEITITGYSGIPSNGEVMNIYPNPATDNVVINAQPNALVAIYSMTGAVVMEGASNTTLDVSALEAGIYQVVITENGTKSTQKLIIQ
ncbi:MAG: T9SS type A sorting domain-containing protein [Crocinitomicaceae bacterium]